MPETVQKIFIISGPSRVGKDAIVQELLLIDRLNLQKVVTATSRPIRPDETNGIDYHFFTKEDFEKKIKEGYFLEWAILSGDRYYGTPMNEFDRIKSLNKNVVLKIDVQGAAQLARIRDDIVRIFIYPDSIENLKKRMMASDFTKEQMKARFKDLERELKEARNYDYSIVNKEGRLEDAVQEVANIFRKEISSEIS